PACVLVCFRCSRGHPDLHSFPTRRSSDLEPAPSQSRYRLRERSGGGGEAGLQLPRDSRAGKLDRAEHNQEGQHHRSHRPEWQVRSEEHTSELQSRENLVCRLLLEKKKKKK